jgi:Subtilase family./Fn3-like domain (DUF1034)./S-layer homology domain.
MSKRKSWSIVLALLLIVSTVSPAFGITLDRSSTLPSKITYSEPDEIVRIIVELEGAPILERAIKNGVTYQQLDKNIIADESAKLVAAQNDVKNEILGFSNEAVFRHSYVRSYNGFSADIKYSAISEIEALDNVKSVHIANKYELPEPQMTTSGGMVHVDSMWNLGYKGEGMLVAVLDTGIDYQHQDFKLTDNNTGKLSLANVTNILAANDLAVEEFAATESLTITANDLYKSAKVPFAFDYADIDTTVKPDMSKADASMHGVHVSGTVGANGQIKGIAPEAQIASMKIFSDDSPYAYEDDIVAGIDDAILIGADAINMSLGATAGFTADDDPEQQAILRAKTAGIVVAVSAGNSARFGASSGFPQDLTYTWNPDTGLLGSPSAGTGTFSVASIENIYAMSPYVLSSGNVKMQYAPAGNADPNEVFNAGAVEYVFCGFGSQEEFDEVNVTGKIALISRGSYAFTEKISNAQTNGAIGAIVFNNQGDSMVNMQYPEDGTIPALFLTQTDGEILRDATVKTLTFDASYVDSFVNPTAGTMSDFSSWGPTPSLEFKPEITAPGGDIYSTVNDNKYESMSGTSMAAPHIAGASAIMLQYINDNPNHYFDGLTPFAQGKLAKALMMSTAVPVETFGVEYSPRKQGAGMLDLEAAVLTDVYAYATTTPGEAKVALGEIDPIFSFDVTLDNFSGNDHEFAITASSITDGMYNGTLPYNTGTPIDLSGAVINVSGTGLKTATVTTAGVYAVTTTVAVNTINVFNAKDVMTTSGSPIVILPISGNSTETITVTVDLTNANPYVAANYFNGYFAEGFVQFLNISEADNNPDVNIPYMGFVGEWEEAPIFDDDIYMGNDYSYFDPQYQSMMSIVDTGNGVYDGFFLGQNPITNTAAYENIAISPNGDGVYDNAAVLMSLLRNAKSINVSITDADMNILDYISLNEIANVRKPYLSNGVFTPYEFPTPENELASLIWDGKIDGALVEDGQYYYVVEAEVDGGFGTQFYAYPVIVDTLAPIVTKFAVAENELTIDVVDTTAIMTYELIDADDNVVAASATNVIDITGLNLADLRAVVTDYAGNANTLSVAVDTSTPSTPSTPPSAGGSTGTTNPPVVTTPDPGNVDPTSVTVSENENASFVNILGGEIEKALATSTNNSVEIKLPSTLTPGKPVEITLPAASMKALQEAGASVVIEGSGMSFTLNSGFTNETMDNNVVVKINKTSIDNYNVSSEYKPLEIVYDFDVLIGDKKVQKFNKKPEISLELPAGTMGADKVGAYVQNEDSSWTYVMTFYDAATNTVKFKAPHFSKYALMSFSKTFDDIKGHWAQANIEEMASKHVASGKTDQLFAPNATITRAEFVAMIINAMGETNVGTGMFTDVAAGTWYEGYLAKAKDLGLISADANGNFKPLDNITRQDIATITAKAHAIINNIDLTDKTPSITFTDAKTVDSALSKYVGYVQEKGIIVGYNNMFRPLDEATRAEAISIIKEMLTK